MQKYVVGFMYSSSFKDVALIHKKRPAWQNGLLNGVGGKIELTDASIQASISREFHEEAGLNTDAEDWTHFCTIRSDEPYEVHFLFTVNDNIFDTKSQTDEEIIICKTDDLPPNVIQNLRWLIPMSLDQGIKYEKPIYINHM